MRIEVESTQLIALLEDAWHKVHRDPVTSLRLSSLPSSAGMNYVVKQVVAKTVEALNGVIEVHPAPKDHVIPAQGALLNRDFCISLLGAILMWNDGEPINFKQSDFDAVAGMVLLEGRNSDGDYCLAMTKKVAENESMQ